MLNRNHKRNNAAEHSSVKAPLALPEHIEISDYAQVKVRKVAIDILLSLSINSFCLFCFSPQS